MVSPDVVASRPMKAEKSMTVTLDFLRDAPPTQNGRLARWSGLGVANLQAAHSQSERQIKSSTRTNISPAVPGFQHSQTAPAKPRVTSLIGPRAGHPAVSVGIFE
jgi:hypothetical protein